MSLFQVSQYLTKMLTMIALLAVRSVHRGWGCAAAFQVARNSVVSTPFLPHPSRRSIGHHQVLASPIISCNDAETSLAKIIKEAYEDRETDGVQDIIRANQVVEQLSTKGDVNAVADELVNAAVEASTSNKSLAAILNAILAACCDSNRSEETESVALAILELIDEMHDEEESSMIEPDIVTLSLVYYLLCNLSSHKESAQLILERAQQMSKKAAGSSRRRALAAERRKGINNAKLDTKEAEKQLQSIYGPDIHILHDSDDLIVLSKPAGQVCYHTKKTSAGKISAKRKKMKKGAAPDDDGSKVDISLEDCLLDMNFALSTVNPVARGIVHRLDRGTSGCICVAKSNEAHLKLVASFFLRRVTKKYLAIVRSPSSPLQQEGVIDALVGGKPATSKYRVVSTYHGDGPSSQGVTLLEVETLTGRKHQVRVHCAESNGLGLPIIFDPLYSSFQPPAPVSRRKAKKDPQRNKRGKADNTEETDQSSLPKAISDLEGTMVPGQERFFLHAQTLIIPEFDVDVQAPLPEWWTATLDQLER